MVYLHEAASHIRHFHVVPIDTLALQYLAFVKPLAYGVLFWR
jgi:hypothetical protein